MRAPTSLEAVARSWSALEQVPNALRSIAVPDDGFLYQSTLYEALTDRGCTFQQANGVVNNIFIYVMHHRGGLRLQPANGSGMDEVALSWRLIERWLEEKYQ